MMFFFPSLISTSSVVDGVMIDKNVLPGARFGLHLWQNCVLKLRANHLFSCLYLDKA